MTEPKTITEADGVFQGGGVKGLALVGGLLGFAQGDEQVKIERWANVAGTSAGAIVAAFLATGSSPQALEELMRRMPYEKFEDWGPGGAVLSGGLNLLRHHGLAHGKYFHDWLDKELGEKTFVDLKRAADDPQDKADDDYRLRVIATDVTNREMLVLPSDLGKYRHPGSSEPIDPDATKVADAVRMSMSIPYFFQPVLLERIETGKLSTIVDGGVLSNFPVWLFDVYDRAPRRPTFGFHLTGGKGVGGALGHVIDGLGWPVALGADIFHTSTEAWDKRFMAHSTVVRTCSISAGDVGTTDFSLDERGRQGLIESGKRAAREFLADFEVERYINTFGEKLARPD